MTDQGTKRAAKVRKREKAREADMSRIDAREARLRKALIDAGGEAGEPMTTLVHFFTTYHDKPRPDLMLDALDWVLALNLMALPEHRYGIAGAIRGVMDLVPPVLVPDPADDIALSTPDDAPAGPPPEPPFIRAWREHYPKILESVDRLVPPEHDVAINRTGHIDYMGMRWMVAREAQQLARVIRLSHRDDEVGEAAAVFLDQFGSMNVVQEARFRAAGIHIPTAESQAAAAREMERAQQVDDLVRYLTATPSEREHMIYVGWVPDKTGGAFTIATVDGQPPKHLPGEWNGRSILVRKATGAELAANRRLAAEKDAP